MESGEVKLKSSDGKIFEVPIDILQKSILFTDINQNDEDEENEIELKEIDGKNLESRTPIFF